MRGRDFKFYMSALGVCFCFSYKNITVFLQISVSKNYSSQMLTEVFLGLDS